MIKLQKCDNLALTEAKKTTIREATARDEFCKDEPETEKGETITEVLDRCAEEAEDFYAILAAEIEYGIIPEDEEETNHFNPLFVGPTGAGKTSIIKKWAHDNGYELVTMNMMGDALDFLGVKDVNRDYDLQVDDKGNTEKTSRVTTIATKAFDKFLFGSTKILFLDEINKTNPDILKAIYDLISFHYVQNGDDLMFLPKLLFTVGAMNPSDYGNRDPLDPALKARLHIYHVNYDTEGLKNYLLTNLSKKITAIETAIKDAKKQGNEALLQKWSKRYEKVAGRKDLAEKIFSDLSAIKWTAPDKITSVGDTDPIMTPRTFEAALYTCDGSKADFIREVKIECGLDAAKDMIAILNGYEDKDHKANLIWDKDYSVKEKKTIDTSAEKEIAANASEDDKKSGGLNHDWYGKLSQTKK